MIHHLHTRTREERQATMLSAAYAAPHAAWNSQSRKDMSPSYPMPFADKTNVSNNALPTLAKMLEKTAPAHAPQPSYHHSAPIQIEIPPHLQRTTWPTTTATRPRGLSVSSSVSMESSTISNSPSCVEAYSYRSQSSVPLEALEDGVIDDEETFSLDGPASPSGPDDNERLNQVDGAKPRSRKRSRYLRELDRRVILERLLRGEKQVVLAKEYNVSRAAVCNLFKHRDEILARTHEDPLAKHPKKRKTLVRSDGRPRRIRCRLSAGPPSPLKDNAWVQVKSDPIQVQLAKLGDRHIEPSAFKQNLNRLLWLFMEEALSLVPIKFTNVVVSENGTTSHGSGVAIEHAPYVISMDSNTEGPMVQVVRSIDPSIPVGYLLPASTTTMSTTETLVCPSDVALSALKYHNVFLVDLALFDGERLCERIASVKRHGALEVMLYVVVMFTSREVIDRVREAFSNVHFVVLQASESWPPQGPGVVPAELLLDRVDRILHTQYNVSCHRGDNQTD